MTTITLSSTRSTFSWKAASIQLAQICLFTALTALAAQIRFPLPGNPVPITLQSLAVILSGAFLGSRKGALSQILLIVLGSAGLAVFSQPNPGYIVLLGPTGGYIFGFVLAAYVSGWISENTPKTSFTNRNIQLFLASLFIFLPGVVWLKTYTGQSLTHAIQLGFVPFIVGDLVKTVIAASIVSSTKTIRLFR
ncbi:MAG: hypothetical protein JWQ35_104 [Bacteriovoracaceae bacterium]|nr:hypothetical protein [Bacteriovoracaceae bacterium]